MERADFEPAAHSDRNERYPYFGDKKLQALHRIDESHFCLLPGGSTCKKAGFARNNYLSFPNSRARSAAARTADMIV